MPDKRRKLYERVSKIANVGSEEDFNALLDDDNKRRVLYDRLSQRANVGTREQFDEAFGPKKDQPKTAEPGTAEGAGAPAAMTTRETAGAPAVDAVDAVETAGDAVVKTAGEAAGKAAVKTAGETAETVTGDASGTGYEYVDEMEGADLAGLTDVDKTDRVGKKDVYPSAAVRRFGEIKPELKPMTEKYISDVFTESMKSRYGQGVSFEKPYTASDGSAFYTEAEANEYIQKKNKEAEDTQKAIERQRRVVELGSINNKIKAGGLSKREKDELVKARKDLEMVLSQTEVRDLDDAALRKEMAPIVRAWDAANSGVAYNVSLPEVMIKPEGVKYNLPKAKGSVGMKPVEDEPRTARQDEGDITEWNPEAVQIDKDEQEDDLAGLNETQKMAVDLSHSQDYYVSVRKEADRRLNGRVVSAMQSTVLPLFNKKMDEAEALGAKKVGEYEQKYMTANDMMRIGSAGPMAGAGGALLFGRQGEIERYYDPAPIVDEVMKSPEVSRMMQGVIAQSMGLDEAKAQSEDRDEARGMFEQFVGMGVIPNTEDEFVRLSKALQDKEAFAEYYDQNLEGKIDRSKQDFLDAMDEDQLTPEEETATTRLQNYYADKVAGMVQDELLKEYKKRNAPESVLEAIGDSAFRGMLLGNLIGTVGEKLGRSSGLRRQLRDEVLADYLEKQDHIIKFLPESMQTAGDELVKMSPGVLSLLGDTLTMGFFLPSRVAGLASAGTGWLLRQAGKTAVKDIASTALKKSSAELLGEWMVGLPSWKKFLAGSAMRGVSGAVNFGLYGGEQYLVNAYREGKGDLGGFLKAVGEEGIKGAPMAFGQVAVPLAEKAITKGQQIRANIARMGTSAVALSVPEMVTELSSDNGLTVAEAVGGLAHSAVMILAMEAHGLGRTGYRTGEVGEGMFFKGADEKYLKPVREALNEISKKEFKTEGDRRRAIGNVMRTFGKDSNVPQYLRLKIQSRYPQYFDGKVDGLSPVEKTEMVAEDGRFYVEGRSGSGDLVYREEYRTKELADRAVTYNENRWISENISLLEGATVTKNIKRVVADMVEDAEDKQDIADALNTEADIIHKVEKTARRRGWTEERKQEEIDKRLETRLTDEQKQILAEVEDKAYYLETVLTAKLDVEAQRIKDETGVDIAAAREKAAKGRELTDAEGRALREYISVIKEETLKLHGVANMEDLGRAHRLMGRQAMTADERHQIGLKVKDNMGELLKYEGGLEYARAIKDMVDEGRTDEEFHDWVIRQKGKEGLEDAMTDYFMSLQSLKSNFDEALKMERKARADALSAKQEEINDYIYITEDAQGRPLKVVTTAVDGGEQVYIVPAESGNSFVVYRADGSREMLSRSTMERRFSQGVLTETVDAILERAGGDQYIPTADKAEREVNHNEKTKDIIKGEIIETGNGRYYVARTDGQEAQLVPVKEVFKDGEILDVPSGDIVRIKVEDALRLQDEHYDAADAENIKKQAAAEREAKAADLKARKQAIEDRKKAEQADAEEKAKRAAEAQAQIDEMVKTNDAERETRQREEYQRLFPTLKTVEDVDAAIEQVQIYTEEANLTEEQLKFQNARLNDLETLKYMLERQHTIDYINTFAKENGYKVKFYTPDNAMENGKFVGDTIYINPDSRASIGFIGGHELLHGMKQNNAESAKEFVSMAVEVWKQDRFNRGLDADSEYETLKKRYVDYAKKVNRQLPVDQREADDVIEAKYGSEAIDEEIAADVAGSMFGDTEILDKMADGVKDQKTLTLFGAFTDNIINAMKKMKKAFGSRNQKNDLDRLIEAWQEAYKGAVEKINQPETTEAGTAEGVGAPVVETRDERQEARDEADPYRVWNGYEFVDSVPQPRTASRFVTHDPNDMIPAKRENGKEWDEIDMRHIEGAVERCLEYVEDLREWEGMKDNNEGYERRKKYLEDLLAKTLSRLEQAGLTEDELNNIVKTLSIDKKIVPLLSYGHEETIEKQKATMLPSVEWGEGFPKVVVHTTLPTIHRKYDFLHRKAKAGDIDAALELVDEVMKPSVIENLKKQYPDAIVITPQYIDGDGHNAIPVAMATKMAEAGFDVDTSLAQVTVSLHTGANRDSRLALQHRYVGDVEAGRQYIIVDDHTTAGGSMRAMKDYIASKGGKVVSAMSLSASAGATQLAITDKTLDQLSKLGITNEHLKELGIGDNLRGLSEGEGRRLVAISLRERNKSAQRGGSGNVSFSKTKEGWQVKEDPTQPKTAERKGLIQPEKTETKKLAQPKTADVREENQKQNEQLHAAVNIDGLHACGNYYGKDGLQSIARGVKDGDAEAIEKAAGILARNLPKDVVLVPMPSHTGRSSVMLDVCRRISEINGNTVVDALKGADRVSMYDAKKKNVYVGKDEMGFISNQDLTDKKVVIIDNVISSGTTAEAAMDAIPGAQVLALAIDKSNYEVNKVLRDSGIRNITLTIDPSNMHTYDITENGRKLKNLFIANNNGEISIGLRGTRHKRFANKYGYTFDGGIRFDEPSVTTKVDAETLPEKLQQFKKELGFETAEGVGTPAAEMRDERRETREGASQGQLGEEENFSARVDKLIEDSGLRNIKVSAINDSVFNIVENGITLDSHLNIYDHNGGIYLRMSGNGHKKFADSNGYIYERGNRLLYPAVMVEVDAETLPEKLQQFKKELGIEMAGKTPSEKYSLMVDRDYLKAVEAGDMELAEEMVKDAVAKAMPETKIVGRDGRPMKVYHGTYEQFNEFDMSKGRNNMDIKGAFFSPWELDAQGYGPNLRAFYIDIKNPASETQGYRALRRHQGENNAGMKAREDLIAMGYDGVNNHDEEFIAFYPEQIKSADAVTRDNDGNVIPLSERFMSGKDIRWSIDTMFEPVGLNFEKGKNGETVLKDDSGNIVDHISKDRVWESPIGAGLRYAVEQKTISKDDAEKQLDFFTGLYNNLAKTNDLDLVYAVSGAIGFQPVNPGERPIEKTDRYDWIVPNKFSGITQNSDPQYGTTVDFTTICLKTQAVIDAASRFMMAKHRGLTNEEMINLIYKNVHYAGEPVPCPVCYVFSRWVGLGGLLDTMKKNQDKWGSAAEGEVIAEVNRIESELLKNWKKKDFLSTESRESLEKRLLEAQQDIAIKASKEGRRLTAKERKRIASYGYDLDLLKNLSWLRNVRLCVEEVKDGKSVKTVYHPERYVAVPDDVLFNINDAKTFVTKYPVSWKFRTTRGSAMGKATTPYAPAHFGQVLRLASANGINDKAAGDMKKNPFIQLDDNGSFTTSALRALKDSEARVKRQNLIGGQRYQSTSDFRPEYALDYLISLYEMELLGSKIQEYTKVAESVGLMASAGAEVNCSLMPKRNGFDLKDGMTVEELDEIVAKRHAEGESYDEIYRSLIADGTMKMVNSNTTGMDERAAFTLSARWDNVQPIMVGVNRDHIRMCMADDKITFIIPYHKSGSGSDRYRWMMDALGETIEESGREDFEPYQSDQPMKETTLQQKLASSARQKILNNPKALTAEEKNVIRTLSIEGVNGEDVFILRDLYERMTGRTLDGKKAVIDVAKYGSAEETLGISFTKDGAKQIFPYEYWDQRTTIKDAHKNGEVFLRYCEALGLHPRFSGWKEKGKKYDPEFNLTDNKGYWKTLIDRKMYNNDGTYHTPKKINISNVDMRYFGKDGWDNMKEDVGVDFRETRINDAQKQQTIESVNIGMQELYEETKLDGETFTQWRERVDTSGTKRGVLFDKLYKGDYEGAKALTKYSLGNGFFSNAERGVADAKMEKGTGEQWINYLKNNGGLKAEEDKWMGLSEWLKEAQRRNEENGGKGVVTKEEVLKFIAENRLRILDYNYVENPISYEVLENYNKKFKQYIYEASQEMDENSQPGDWADAAFERLKEEESDADYDFGDAVEINYFTEELEPALDFDDNLSRAGIYYLTDGTKEPINSTRLVYTTEGLKDKREIALAVPSIEPYRADDHVHFGDAGEGRAVAWIRFGDAAAKDGSKVLVIDEIQSERHQGGRERGYKNPGEPGYDELKAEYDAANKKYKDFGKELADKYGGETEALLKSTREEHNELLKLRDEMEEKFDRYIDYNPKDDRRVPIAPFQKNWHELAMKRMLRYAAENGYDKVAWTTGVQQTERYDIGGRVSYITTEDYGVDENGKDIKQVIIYPIKENVNAVLMEIDSDGNVISGSGGTVGKNISEVVGKDIAQRIMSGEPRISGADLTIGGEGMKGFYDRMLPQYMDKYGKKWGVKTENVELNLPKPADRVMHSVDVTPEMRESVMKGQPMWSLDGGDQPMTADPLEQFGLRSKKVEKLPYTAEVLKGFVPKTQEEEKLAGHVEAMARYSLMGQRGVANLDNFDKNRKAALEMYKAAYDAAKKNGMRQSTVRLYENILRDFITLDKERGSQRAADLRMAMQLEKKGSLFPPEAIKQYTGWEKGKDGLWRYEAGDAIFKPEALNDIENAIRNVNSKSDFSYTGMMMDLVDAPEIFTAYPELRKMKVFLYADESDTLGSFVGDSMNINANWYYGGLKINDKMRPAVRDYVVSGINATLNHEIQHYIQDVEGFAQGGTSKTVRKLLDDIVKNHEDFVNSFGNNTKYLGEVNTILNGLNNHEMYAKMVRGNKESLAAGDIMYSVIDSYFSAMDNVANYAALFGVSPKDYGLDIQKYEKRVAELEKKGYTPLDIAMEAPMKDKVKKFYKGVEKAIEDANPGIKDAMSYKYLKQIVDAANGDTRLYRNLAGEVEARVIEKRTGLSKKMKRNSLTSQMEDVDRSMQIPIRDNQRIIGEVEDPLAQFGLRSRPAGFTKYSLDESLQESVKQTYGSADTSINATKLPAIFGKIDWKEDTKNLDMGGGKFDNAVAWLADRGVESMVYDPFNRNVENNRRIAEVARKRDFDTATCSNCLNVINTAGARSNVILQCAKALKKDGTAYFTIYEGNKSGVGRKTKDDCWQENRKTASYIPEVQQHFGDVTMKNNVIVAKEPIVDGKTSVWNYDASGANSSKFSLSPETRRTVVSPLKKGRKTERGGFGGSVGKEMGDNFYVHKDYAEGVIKDAMKKGEGYLPDGFDYKVVVYDRKNPNQIKYVEAPDFDTAREPIPGRILTVDINNGDIIRDTYSKSIWHHKWEWVGDDYKGFDVDKSREWSQQWYDTIEDIKGIGSKDVWDRKLKENGLPVERVKYSLGSGDAEDKRVGMGSYFSGAGLLEEGLKGSIDPKIAVEYSSDIAGVYADNFGNHIITKDVRDVDIDELKKAKGSVQYFHASPVCKRASMANANGGEIELDKETAQATAKAIEVLEPKIVTIENVPEYENFDAIKLITDKLEEMGYTIDTNVYNAKDFGAPMSRERLILRATKGVEIPQPRTAEGASAGWYDAVKDIVNDLPDAEGLADWQVERFRKEGVDWENTDKPIIVYGGGSVFGGNLYAYADEAAPSLSTKAGSGARIILPGGVIKQATPRVFARLMGVGDDYRLPAKKTLAYQILGNGIPTQLTKAVIAPLLEKIPEGGGDQPRTVDPLAQFGLRSKMESDKEQPYTAAGGVNNAMAKYSLEPLESSGDANKDEKIYRKDKSIETIRQKQDRALEILRVQQKTAEEREREQAEWEARDEGLDFYEEMEDAKIDISREGIKKTIRDEIRERRRMIESGNFEDAVMKEKVKSMTTAEERKQIPFLLESDESLYVDTPEYAELVKARGAYRKKQLQYQGVLYPIKKQMETNEFMVNHPDLSLDPDYRGLTDEQAARKYLGTLPEYQELESLLEPYKKAEEAFVRMKENDPRTPSARMQEVLGMIRNWYDEIYNVMTKEGLFERKEYERYVNNYCTHIWDFENSDPVAVGMMQSYLRTNSPYTRERIIKTIQDGLEMGLKLKYDDITDVMMEYGHYATEAIANRRMLNFLRDFAVQEDIETKQGKITIYKPLLIRDHNKDADYVRIDNTALDGWKVYKPCVNDLNIVFGKQHWSDSPALQKLGHMYDVASGTMKKINLSMSFFHHGALTETAVSMMGPAKFAKTLVKNMIWDAAMKKKMPIMMDVEATRDAVNHFVQLGVTQDYAAKEVNLLTESIAKWLKEHNWHGAAEIAAAADWLNKGMDTVLWDWMHDSYKVYSFKKVADELRNNADKNGWTPIQLDEALDEAGQLVNDTFGGQHWDMLGQSPSAVRWYRRLLLSPDWTISTIRQALSPFGVGQMYNDDAFWKKWFKKDPVSEARKKYGRIFWLNAALVFVPLMNGLNAYFRRKDEEEEKVKADEIRKDKPDYKSPYELAYPDGMKWYDYTFLGNTMGHQTHMFTGRYDDGSEMYLRWGKQFRELPELFFGRDGFSIPGPMIDKMAGKLNPMINTLSNIIGGKSLNGWENDYMKDKEGWARELGRLYVLISSYTPYSIPTDEEKEFVLSSLVMPDAKGFSAYKGKKYFQTAIASGDEAMCAKVYDACVKNGLNAEELFRTTLSSMEAEVRKQMLMGFEDVNDAVKAFDEEKNPKRRKTIERYIKQQLDAQDHNQISKAEMMDNFEALSVDGVTPEEEKIYDATKTSADVIEDRRVAKAKAGLKQWDDEYKAVKKEAGDQGDYGKERTEKLKIFRDGNLQQLEMYHKFGYAQSLINRLKRQMDGTDGDKRIFDKIREVRKDVLDDDRSSYQQWKQKWVNQLKRDRLWK